VPPALVEQLKPGGRMVIPLGSWPHGQELTIVDKDDDGRVRERGILPVAFVPLVEATFRRPGR
jgi:protein-L-isoaspartate(D-aspartate) O-methyltransferase